MSQIKQVMLGLLKGLAYMDSKRIIHRDLKPENILFRSENSAEVVIADFGLSTWAEEPNYLFVRCGTPGFVAPQIINIKDMSTRSDPISDMFSAGLIFHNLLLGRSVFKGSKYAEILAQNRSCDFTLIGPEYDSMDSSAFLLLKLMLQINPKTRIRAAAALQHSFFASSMELQEPTKQVFENVLSFKSPKVLSLFQACPALAKNRSEVKRKDREDSFYINTTRQQVRKKREVLVKLSDNGRHSGHV